VYPATKAFVLAFTEALNAELGPQGVRVQVVLPGITRTAIWTDEQMASLPAHMVMEVDEMVDAALRGFDIGETITMPALPDNADRYLYRGAHGAPSESVARSRRRAIRSVTPCTNEDPGVRAPGSFCLLAALS